MAKKKYRGKRQWVVTYTTITGEDAGYYTCNSPEVARKTLLRGRNEGHIVKIKPPLPEKFATIHPAIIRSDVARAEARQANSPHLIKWRKERGHLYEQEAQETQAPGDDSA